MWVAGDLRLRPTDDGGQVRIWREADEASYPAMGGDEPLTIVEVTQDGQQLGVLTSDGTRRDSCWQAS